MKIKHVWILCFLVLFLTGCSRLEPLAEETTAPAPAATTMPTESVETTEPAETTETSVAETFVVLAPEEQETETPDPSPTSPSDTATEPVKPKPGGEENGNGSSTGSETTGGSEWTPPVL